MKVWAWRLVPPLVGLAIIATAAAMYPRMSNPIEPRVPGRDRPAGAVANTVDWSSCKPVTFAGQAGGPSGSWPSFRGPQRDGISHEDTPLVRDWPKDGPTRLWEIPTGEGHAGPAVIDGRIYLLDYDPPDTWLIKPQELSSVVEAGRRLADASSPAASHILGMMPDDARSWIAAQGRPDQGQPAGQLADTLNDLVLNKDLYDKAAFAVLMDAKSANSLGGEAKRLIRSQSRSRYDQLRLNRLLLEAVLGDALARSRHGDVLRCISLKTGQDIWRLSWPIRTRQNHGMSRTVPAVTKDYVVAMAPRCQVVCADARTGELRWAKDLVAEYQAHEPDWYAGQCPLIEGDLAIIAPGGKALMIAVELSSGKVRWETPNPRNWQMTHSSVATMQVDGQKMYVYCGSDGVAGVDASTGKLLWDTTAWRVNIANVPTPVPVGDGRVFLSAGYDTGCMMLKVFREGDTWNAQPLWRLKAEQFGAAQHTPVLHNGHIYGVRPDGQMTCLDLDGNIVWTSGPANRFGMGYGSWIVADDMLLIMNDTATLTAAGADSRGYRRLAGARLFKDARDSWAPLAMVNGLLLVRDYSRMVCLDLQE